MGQASSRESSADTDLDSYLDAINPKTTMASNKVWLVTGATSGIGLELAKAAIAAGHTVIAGCRDTAKNQVVTSELETLGVTWLQLDVGEDDVVARVQNAIAEHGHIDVLVNNAGYALAGAIEDTR